MYPYGYGSEAIQHEIITIMSIFDDILMKNFQFSIIIYLGYCPN